MIQVVRYTSEQAQEWDALVRESKNGTFLFLRPYMDYHGYDPVANPTGRFHDHSLMYYDDKGKLLAVLPANEVLSACPDGTHRLYSHQGLTYGGFVFTLRAHATEVGELFTVTLNYLRERGFGEWRYKSVPDIYHLQPAEDDEFFLWQHQAQLIDCSLLSAIPLGDGMQVSSSKRNNSNRLERLGYRICLDAPIAQFWPILEQNLQARFNARPVHTYDEMMLLQSRFPAEIKCCTVQAPDGTVLAGTVLYLTTQVVKAQYTSASPMGKQLKVLDYLILQLLHFFSAQPQYRYFDFGTSMLADSVELNAGLVSQKEGFGARGIASRIYCLTVSRAPVGGSAV